MMRNTAISFAKFGMPWILGCFVTTSVGPSVHEDMVEVKIASKVDLSEGAQGAATRFSGS
jgi:hypothetical protein